MSTRMGGIKLLMPFGESTLLETMMAAVRGSTVSEVVVVLGASPEEIRGKISFPQIKVRRGSFLTRSEVANAFG
jgi:CTP:molybdopterin cytidylyltransferase MocA